MEPDPCQVTSLRRFVNLHSKLLHRRYPFLIFWCREAFWNGHELSASNDENIHCLLGHLLLIFFHIRYVLGMVWVLLHPPPNVHQWRSGLGHSQSNRSHQEWWDCLHLEMHP